MSTRSLNIEREGFVCGEAGVGVEFVVAGAAEEAVAPFAAFEDIPAATAGVDQSWRQYESELPPTTGVLRVSVEGRLPVTGMAAQSALFMSATVTVNAEAVGRVHRVAAAMQAAATPERLKDRRNMGLS